MNINIDSQEWYWNELDKRSQYNERTRKRMQQIIDAGMTIVGHGQFGIPDLMSGLYIEKVWSYSDEEWDEYMKWVDDMKTNPPAYNTKYKKILESPMIKHVGKTGTQERDEQRHT